MPVLVRDAEKRRHNLATGTNVALSFANGRNIFQRMVAARQADADGQSTADTKRRLRPLVPRRAGPAGGVVGAYASGSEHTCGRRAAYRRADGDSTLVFRAPAGRVHADPSRRRRQ